MGWRQTCRDFARLALLAGLLNLLAAGFAHAVPQTFQQCQQEENAAFSRWQQLGNTYDYLWGVMAQTRNMSINNQLMGLRPQIHDAKVQMDELSRYCSVLQQQEIDARQRQLAQQRAASALAAQNQQSVNAVTELVQEVNQLNSLRRDPVGTVVNNAMGQASDIAQDAVAGSRATGNPVVDSAHNLARGALEVQSNDGIKAVQGAALADIQRTQGLTLGAAQTVTDGIGNFASTVGATQNPWAAGATLYVKDADVQASDTIRGGSPNAEGSGGTNSAPPNPWAAAPTATLVANSPYSSSDTSTNPWATQPTAATPATPIGATTTYVTADGQSLTLQPGETLYRPVAGAPLSVVPLSAVDKTLGGDIPGLCSSSGIGRVIAQCELQRAPQ